jgi:tRNA 5-methylaminomethyl-2-thiouridine biosynthesis bifunctional protein
MIKQAQIHWSKNTPISSEFDDVYFSTDNGLDETRYVFLESSQLAKRWQASNGKNFSICETGFGSGLSFLCTWQLWLEHSQSEQQLHFLSVEKFPIGHSDLKRILDQWPELSELSQQLINQYPPLVPGWHTLHFNNSDQQGCVTLHLFFGDIDEWLPKINRPVDAWFLDGFAPAKNPEMWQQPLFTHIARLTQSLGTVATFTAASNIKRALKSAGFSLKKTPGYGKKREMVVATQTHNNGPQAPYYVANSPWYEIPKLKESHPKKAIVIGAGIAGCSTAYALAKRGWQVQILEKEDSVASGASGNMQGVLYAKLATELIPHSQFYLAGYLYSLNLLKKQLSKKHWDNCGVLQLAMNAKEIKRQRSFEEKTQLQSIIQAVNAQQASDIAGVDIQQSGLYFKNGAWVYPTAWCKELIENKRIEVHYQQNIKEISNKDSNWLAHNQSGDTFEADVVIVCNAQQAKSFSQLSFLPTKPIAGQVSQVDAPKMKLNTVLCGGHYVTPTLNGQLNFGASYRLNSESCQVLNEEHQDNLNTLNEEFPSIGMQLTGKEPLTGRASVRCTSPDYTPIAGPICDPQRFSLDFSALAKSKKWKFYQSAQFIEGLYVNLGHGSRGLSSAPLCGELIAAQICQEPCPMPEELAQMVNPNRFLVKNLTK